MNTEVMFSSKTDSWATPQYFFDDLNKAWNFDIDVCADEHNAKCKTFFSKEQDGLKQEWIGTCFMNPPYGKEIGKWVKKAYEESVTKSCVVVALLPARVDTKWFHQYIYNRENVFVEFLKGRLKFEDSKNSAPFPSMIVYFNFKNLKQ